MRWVLFVVVAAFLSGCSQAKSERERAEAAMAEAKAAQAKLDAEKARLQSQQKKLSPGEFNGTRIFDGTTFDGWEGNMDMFRIEDGAIVAGNLSEKIPNNEFLCTTQEYEDFELRLKVKEVGDGCNAGIQFRSQRVPNHHEVSGYQADVGKGWWGKLYDESRRNKTLVGKDNSSLVKQDDWNEYVIRCEGPRVQLFLNGELTVDYTEEDANIPTKGIIGLQIHGGPPCEAWYKDIQLQEL